MKLTVKDKIFTLLIKSKRMSGEWSDCTWEGVAFSFISSDTTAKARREKRNMVPLRLAIWVHSHT